MVEYGTKWNEMFGYMKYGLEFVFQTNRSDNNLALKAKNKNNSS